MAIIFYTKLNRNVNITLEIKKKNVWRLGHSMARMMRHRGRALTRGGCLHKELR